MNDDLRMDIGENVRTLFRKDFPKTLMEVTQCEREFSTYMWMRSLEDRVYKKMAKDLGRDDPKSWPSYKDLVDKYVAKCDVNILTANDFHHLREATHRETANTHAHPDFGTSKLQN